MKSSFRLPHIRLGEFLGCKKDLYSLFYYWQILSCSIQDTIQRKTVHQRGVSSWQKMRNHQKKKCKIRAKESAEARQPATKGASEEKRKDSTAPEQAAAKPEQQKKKDKKGKQPAREEEPVKEKRT